MGHIVHKCNCTKKLLWTASRSELCLKRSIDHVIMLKWGNVPINVDCMILVKPDKTPIYPSVGSLFLRLPPPRKLWARRFSHPQLVFSAGRIQLVLAVVKIRYFSYKADELINDYILHDKEVKSPSSR
jgi:hypothetical protein